MNKIYSLVWNRARKQLVVASELVRVRGGGNARQGVAVRASLAMTALMSALVLCGGLVLSSPAAAATVAATNACGARTGTAGLQQCKDSDLTSNPVALGIDVVTPDADSLSQYPDTLSLESSQDDVPFGTAGAPLAMVAVAPISMAAMEPLVLPPSAPQRPPSSPTIPPGLIMGTGGLVGNVGGALNPTVTSLLNPDSAYLTSGDLNLAAANITQTYTTLQVLGLTVVNLTPVGTAINGTLMGHNQNLTLLGGVTSGSYITDVNRGTDGFYDGVAGVILPNGSPAWADTCLNLVIASAPCWAVNAAQNNQVIIGDGASANGSEEVVIGTDASHTLPPVDANSVFPGDGNRDSSTNPMGVPDSDYQNRMGHSVVIGDSASGTQDMQTILGADATSDQANSVALGYASDADRGGQSGYTDAYGLVGIPQDSAGEVAVGNAGHERQITHVAAGSDDYDAVNVLQLQGAVTNATANAVEYDDSTHTSITLGGVGAATPVTVTNVAPGALGSGSTDAVNGSQLYSVQQIANNANQGWNVTTTATGSGVANGSSVANVVPGSTATLVADNNIVMTQTGTSVAVGVNPVLTGLTSIAFASGGPVISVTGIDMGDTKISNLADGTDPGDAATIGQLDSAISANANAVEYDDATHTSITLGGVGATAPVALTNVAPGALSAGSTDAVNGSQLYSVQQIANNANQGWNVTTAATGSGIANGTSIANVVPGSTATLVADDNIVISQSGTSVAVGVNPVLTGLTSIAFGGGGPTLNSGGIDMGNTRITSVADAVDGGDAVNLAQVDALTNNGAAAFTSHYFKANGPADGTDDALDAGVQAIAMGPDASAAGDYSVALGVGAVASTRRAIGIGQATTASGAQAFALGTYAAATGDNSVALGGAIDKDGNGSIGAGEFTQATGGLSMALGSASQASQDNATAVGSESLASGLGATTIGSNAVASDTAAVAIGFGAQATADGSIAIGWNSVANAANTVSFGGNGVYRELVNIADPTTTHSAVTLGYLQSHYSTNTAVADLSSELDALSRKFTSSATSDSVVAATANGQSAQTSAEPVAAAPVSDANNAPASAAAQTQQAVASANAYTDTQTQEALQSANTYAQAQSTQTLSAANAYTDAALNNYVTNDTFNQYQQQVDTRFQETDERINKTSAMSTAMVEMAASAAGIDTPNRIGVGVGSTHGKSALAIGYQRAIGKNATFTIGGSATSGESTVGAGVGFGW